MLFLVLQTILLLLISPYAQSTLTLQYQNTTLAQKIPPKVNWINQNIDALSFIISFSCGFDIRSSSTLTNFWLQMDLPFNLTSLSAVTWSEWSSTTAPCCDYSTLTFQSAIPELNHNYDGQYTSFYIQLTGASFVKYRPFI